MSTKVLAHVSVTNVRPHPTARSCIVACACTLLALVAPPASAQPFVPDTLCAADRGVSHLNCTANDIEIASVQVNNPVTSCLAGDPVTLDLTLYLHVNAENRHDIGVFLARDGKYPVIPAASGGSADCAVYGLPQSPVPFANLDGNACGDFDRDGLPQGTAVALPIGLVTVLCIPDQNGYLTIPSVVTWDTSGTATSCQAPMAAWVRPGSPAKCEAGVAAQIPVQVFGRIEVIKQTVPDASPGSVTFAASGPGVIPTNFALGDNGSQVLATGQLGPTAQTYTVTEQALAGFDPTAQIVCVDPDGDARPEFVTIDPTTRTMSVQMSSDGRFGLTDLICTFTNTRQGSITVVKNTVGADGSFAFTGSQSFQITTTGRTGQQVLTNLNPGTYTITETVPAGWDLTSITCVDPTSNTTVAGSTATVVLAAGETVQCTFTDTARGSIQVNKTTVGGNGTFTFVGPGPTTFQITTSVGTGGPYIFANLPPGTYTVVETVPGGWDLTGINCTDPSGGTSTSGNTATIGLAAGETVSCTFTDTRRASITVEKLTTGGDDTFGYTGSQSFSITTTGGTGQDASTFASVTPGTAYTIVETVPTGWSLSGATCRDAGTSAPVGTAITNGVSVTPAAGQSVICTFIDVKLATLRIFKHSQPGSTQSFSFTATGVASMPTVFPLSDGGTDPVSITFANLAPGSNGTYMVTESAVSGWMLTALHCSDLADPNPANRSTVNLATRTVDAHLGPGETLDCTYTNTQIQAGSITVTKHAIGGDDTFGFTTVNSSTTPLPSNFSITTAGTNHTGTQTFTGLQPGTYTITETVPAGWDLAPPPINCTVTSGTSTAITQTTNGVSIALGQTETTVDSVACEFTDVKRGSITVIKQAVGGDDTFAFSTVSPPSTLPANFSITTAGAGHTGSQTFAGLKPGVFAITEQSPPSGWHLTDIHCTGGSAIVTDVATRSAAIELQAGETVVCTYENVKDGTIIISKTAVGGGGAETFTFTGALSGTIAGGGSIVANLPPGTYTASEVVPTGWDLTNIVCTGGSVVITGAATTPSAGFEAGDTTVTVTLGAGETVTCTFTDTKRGSITLVKNTIAGNGTFDFGGARTFQIATVAGTGQDATTFASVAPGSYVVRELVPTGWHLTGLACSNQSSVDLATATATVSVAAGEQVTCTFTDTRLGTITITKRISGDESATFAFTVPTSLDPAGTFTLQPPVDVTTASKVYQNVGPGAYTITEGALPAGWKFTGVTCTDPTGDSVTNDTARSATVNLAAGESVSCTFNNVTLATITISVVSSGGTGTFGFSSSGFGVPIFPLTTSTEGVKASRVFGNLDPGTFVVTGLGAPGWQLYDLFCISDGGETYWNIAGSTVTITVSHGEEIECIYYYLLPAPIIFVPPASAIPVLDPRLLVVLVVCLVLVAASGLRRTGGASRGLGVPTRRGPAPRRGRGMGLPGCD